MNRYLVYVALAIVLGVAVMILPLTIYHQIDLYAEKQPSICGAEKTVSRGKELIVNATSKGKNEALNLKTGEEDSMVRLTASLPEVALIVAVGLSVAILVSMLIKRII